MSFTNMSKEEFEQFSPEDKQQICFVVGATLMNVMFAMQHLGHKTLGGHLRYQRANEHYPDQVHGQVIQWLKWVTAFGNAAKNEIGRPSWITDFAYWFGQESFAEAIEAMSKK